MIDFDFAQSCYHCGGCAQNCPTKAINMCEGSDGFLYPQINQNTCVGCGKCDEVCPSLKVNQNVQPLSERKCFAFSSTDAAERKYSASGGFFFELAKMVVKKGGYVAGCVWDYEKRKAKHVLSNDIEDIKTMRSSKYVWSDTSGIFAEVHRAIKDGKFVLFSGTPCQVAALNNICGDDEHLLTCSIFCHGNASPGVFKTYIEEQLRKNETIKFINFRYHDSKSITDDVFFQFSSGRILHEKKHENKYLRGFFDGIFVSSTCIGNNCHFKGDNIPGDVLCGDYWQYQGKLQAPFVSAILSTTKGEKIIKELQGKTNALFEETDLTSIVKANAYLYQGCVNTPNRRAFLDEYSAIGYKSAYKKYGSLSLWKAVAYKLPLSGVLMKIRKGLKSRS